MGIKNQGSRPSGVIGNIVGRMMNRYHTSIYIKYFKNNMPENNSMILDVGCGGGKFLHYLSENISYQLYGIDHSAEMVTLSKRINKRAIAQDRLKIFQGSASTLINTDKCFDLVTAFETVQFWDDIEKAFSEIAGILCKGGHFIIINRFPRVNSKWWKSAKIKDELEYRLLLGKSGFRHIDFDFEFRNGWIVVKSMK